MTNSILVGENVNNVSVSKVKATTASINKLIARNTSVTYESLYKNMGSYDFSVDMTNKKYIIKTYTLPDGTTITHTTDMLVDNIIVSTITGNTGYDVPIVKTINIDINNDYLNTVYS